MQRYEKMEIMHRVVEYGGLIYLGGVVADDFSKDLGGQTEEVCRKIERLLSKYGSDTSRILSATIFITNMANKEQMSKVWVSWLSPDHLPTRATIGVNDLGKNVLIEVILTAAKLETGQAQ